MKQRDAILSRAIELLSAFVRRIPINRRIKDVFIRRSLALRDHRFEFTFKCKALDLVWSASGFPDLLTRHMMFEGMYQQDVLVALRSLVRRGDIVYDVGGHHGLMAIVSAVATGPSGKVVTFEPNPNARVHLAKHVALNDVPNIIVEDVALSDQQGEVPFFVQVGDVTWNSTLVREFANLSRENRPVAVNTLTLDDYVNRSGLVPNVVKVDTEGSEFLILKGANETLRKHRPVLIVEFNPLSARAAQTTIADYVKFLSEAAYRMVVLRKNLLGYYKVTAQEPFDEVKHSRGDRLVNVICVPLERWGNMSQSEDS